MKKFEFTLWCTICKNFLLIVEKTITIFVVLTMTNKKVHNTTTATTKNRFINCLNISVTKSDQYAAKAVKKCFQR